MQTSVTQHFGACCPGCDENVRPIARGQTPRRAICSERLHRDDHSLDHSRVLYSGESDLGDRFHDRFERAGGEAGARDVPEPSN
jgi:hypothetical protein